MARRGSYAKRVAEREEILERALEVIACEGRFHALTPTEKGETP